MTATDQQKVLDAGFLIIRKEPDCSPKFGRGDTCTAKIKQKTKENREWHILEKWFQKQLCNGTACEGTAKRQVHSIRLIFSVDIGWSVPRLAF